MNKPKPPPNREYRQDQSMDQARSPKQERLPEPKQEQVALGMEAVRRALAGENLLLRRDGEGRLCVVPLDVSDVERA